MVNTVPNKLPIRGYAIPLVVDYCLKPSPHLFHISFSIAYRRKVNLSVKHLTFYIGDSLAIKIKHKSLLYFSPPGKKENNLTVCLSSHN